MSILLLTINTHTYILVRVPSREVGVVRHQGVKGDSALVHERDEHIGEHDECVLQLPITLEETRPFLRVGGR